MTARRRSSLGIGSHRVLFPKGTDADEYGRTGGSLAVLLNRAEWGQATAARQPLIPLAAELEVHVNGDEVLIPRGDRRYRICRLAKNLSPEVIR